MPTSMPCSTPGCCGEPKTAPSNSRTTLYTWTSRCGRRDEHQGRLTRLGRVAWCAERTQAETRMPAPSAETLNKVLHHADASLDASRGRLDRKASCRERV